MAKIKDVYAALQSKPFRDALKKRGFRISRVPKALIPRTFKIPKALSQEFYEVVAKRDMKVQDAVAEGLALWLQKHR